MGLTNVGIMLPMVQHVREFQQAKAIMVEAGMSGAESFLVDLMRSRIGEFSKGVVGAPWHALAVALLMLAQLPLMHRFIQSPVEKALSVSVFGVPLFVAGMMVSAWALRLGYGVAGGPAA